MAKNTGLAAQIDNYLKQKGSPMAGFGHVFVAAGKKHGVDPRLVVGIAGAESSFGKKNFAPHNAWGWGVHLDPQPSWDNWGAAISSVTRGLASGYIQQGLRTPAEIVKRYAPSSDGNDESIWSGNVSTFMKELGASPSLATAKTVISSGPKPPPASVVPTAFKLPSLPELPPLQPSTANLQSALISNLALTAQRGHASGQGLLQGVLQGQLADTQADQAAQAQRDAYEKERAEYMKALQAATAITPTTPAAPAAPAAEPPSEPATGNVFKGPTLPTDPGFPVPKATFIKKSTDHGTANLDGFDGFDYMAPSGSAAVAPANGKVVWLSGHDPAEGPVDGNTHGAMGWSVYVQADDGVVYYMTHMGTRDVKLGDIVSAGQKIGTVANWHKYGTPDHIHMGRGAERYLPDEAKAYLAGGSTSSTDTGTNTGAWVKTAAGADRPGVTTNQSVRDAVAKIAQQHGEPLTITTGTKHNQYVQGHPGRESQHWQGNAADILYGHGTGPHDVDPALTKLGQDALIAAGMSEATARKVMGGFHNVGGWNIGFNTMEGGNHYNHLHVGV